MVKSVHFRRKNKLCCLREENESITHRMRFIAVYCSFGDSLNETIRDQLIFRISSCEFPETLI